MRSERSRGVPERYRRQLPAWAAVAALALAAVVVVLGDPDAPSRLSLFVGRLHPLLVHLPIGFLLLAALLEGLSGVRGFQRVRHAVPVALAASAAGAAAAVVAGWELGASGGYQGSTVDWHRWLGVGVAVGATAACALRLAAAERPRLRRVYAATLLSTLVLLTAASHLGGTLTHGPEYLTEHLPAPLRAALALLPGEATAEPTVTRPDEIRVYEHMVRPVLQSRCVSCHGPDKQKGDLRLDSPEAMLEGGESGPALVAGRADESEILRRVWLPEEHEDHMPPRGRRPLTVAEAELLRWWIEQGAPLDRTAAELDPPRVVEAILEQLAGPLEGQLPAVLRRPVAPADSAALARARTLGLSVRPLADGSGFLQVHCLGNASSCGAEQLQALLPLAEQVTVLDLRGAPVGDAEMPTVARLRHLTRLHLERTAVTDAGLAHLDSLRHLEYLNLHGTSVTDGGLEHLAGLPNLRALYLWRTAATPQGAERLRERQGRVRIDLGLSRSAIDSLRAAAERDPLAAGMEDDVAR